MISGISDEISKIHGITNEFAVSNGIEIKNVLTIIHKDIIRYKVNTILSYNLQFDKNILLSECYKRYDRCGFLPIY